MGSATVRIYQLAQELQVSSAQVLETCRRLKIPVTTASSSISQTEAEQVRAQATPDLHRNGSPLLESEPAEDSSSLSPAAIQNILDQPNLFLNRELSWLWFNERVLHEAFDDRTPLLEKLKFLAIFSTNLDEYFMVRVAGLKQQVEAQVTQRSRDGLTPEQQLEAIRHELLPQVVRQHQYFTQDLRLALEQEGILIRDYQDLGPEQTYYLLQYFRTQIFPVLTPLAVDPSHPFPYISNLSLNLAVVVTDSQSGEPHFARIKVPDKLPRFVQLPTSDLASTEGAIHWCGISIEQVISQHLQDLFPGMNIEGSYLFRITRNSDIALEEDEADDLLLAIEEELRKRRFGSVVRLEVLAGMPANILQSLKQDLDLGDIDIYEVEGLVRLNDLFSLAALNLPHLKYEPWSPVVPTRLANLKPLRSSSNSPLSSTSVVAKGREEGQSIFDIIQDRDLLTHHPYDSFSASVQRFVEEAAYDPDVITIKMTLYRTSGDSMIVSPIVSALIAAAENGKQVVVLVELKARFDEENNILWARQLEQVGVHVVYGVVGLKTHTKIALVVRREGPMIRRYCHIGTGNYNPKTARLYTDLGLFTCNDEIGADLTDLFNYLTGYSRQHAYRRLLVAPHNLRDRMMTLIQQEIEHQQQGRGGRIIAKMNSLIDSKLIAALYLASQAGVKVDLIVRGICSLIPGIPEFSENIRVISIIGRFLEHDRIFYFHNCGAPHVFMGSADWRPRNLDRRVEAVVPIYSSDLAQYLKQLLDIFLSDNRQAWKLTPNGTYTQQHPQPGEPERATHVLLMQLAQQRSHNF
ncbi:polyphosphate kinase 1 [Lyngbya confervoides]|uniref:Polyphosphate kinase n=1 Tax=Lyngbya confervoides BDU141951 TaxID=1574623 RepID=A0ABD4T445_9CYAN|nr:polyphosphate kinase 1 [Lyngbya confervoides]MCM1983463.1 polyphosphate kinase 1 [Lyngbya confervoides BDU141951]